MIFYRYELKVNTVQVGFMLQHANEDVLRDKISLMHNKNYISKKTYPCRKFVLGTKKITTNICNAIRKYFYGFTKT
jgi:hypothetical protein